MKLNEDFTRSALVVVAYAIIGVLAGWHYNHVGLENPDLQALGLLLAGIFAPIVLMYLKFFEIENSEFELIKRYARIITSSIAYVFGASITSNSLFLHPLWWSLLTIIGHPLVMLGLDWLANGWSQKHEEVFESIVFTASFGLVSAILIGIISIPFNVYPSIIVTLILVTIVLVFSLLFGYESGKDRNQRNQYQITVGVCVTIVIGLFSGLFFLTITGLLYGVADGAAIMLLYELCYQLGKRVPQKHRYHSYDDFDDD